MAKHEGKTAEKAHLEHMRHGRKHGGEVDRAEDQDEETHEEEKEAEGEEEHKRAHGGHIPRRKAGGKIEGKKPHHRPDKRARGGATSDMNPESSAGKMSHLPFEKVGSKPDGGGKGMDRD